MTSHNNYTAPIIVGAEQVIPVLPPRQEQAITLPPAPSMEVVEEISLAQYLAGSAVAGGF